MEKLQISSPNACKFALSKSSPQSSTESSSQESHDTTEPTSSEEDSSFTSLEDKFNGFMTNNSSLIPKPSISHFCIASLTTLTPRITCLAVQNHILYAASTKEINVFDLRTFSLMETFGLGWVRSIAFDGGKIFTAHQDCKIRVWQHTKNPSSGRQKHRLIATLPTFKDSLFKSMFAKNYIQIRRHKKKLWSQHSDAVSGLAISDGVMYSASWDRTFKTWKISSGMRCLESIRAAHSDAVNAIVVSPVDKIVYTGSADGQIKAWKQTDDGKTHSLLTSVEKHKSSVNALALTGKGRRVCSGGGDSIIIVWKWGDCGKSLAVGCCLKGHKGAVLSLVNVGKLLISGASDGSVRIWRCGKGLGACLGILEGHSKPVKSLVGIPGRRDLTVLSGSLDGEIRAWKVMCD